MTPTPGQAEVIRRYGVLRRLLARNPHVYITERRDEQGRTMLLLCSRGIVVEAASLDAVLDLVEQKLKESANVVQMPLDLGGGPRDPAAAGTSPDAA